MLVHTRGLSFEVRTGGPADAPAVLLLHGFPQNARMWERTEPLLHAADLRTVAPDQRGYSAGARPAAVADYAVTNLVDDALAIMTSLELDRAHVVGHDWGAAVAWELAARHPERVRTLTAISVPHPRAFTRALLTSPDQLRRSWYILLFRRKGTAERLLTDDDGGRLRRVFHDSGMSADEIDRYAQPMLAPGALTAALNWYRAVSIGRRPGIGPVEVPTTFVWSDRDTAIGRAAAERCGEYVTGDYRFVELAGLSHWIADQAPELLADAILQRIGSPGRGGGPY
jgi:pimeloyl-ACP methyl ester carboxylesterase